MPTVQRSNLHVEGTDDVHVVKHLLLRHGIDCPIRGRPAGDVDPNVPEITAAGGMGAVLAAIKTAIPVSNGRSVGFVLDADTRPQERWQAVRDRLEEFGLEELPGETPNEGFVADIARYRARVGVWLMPGSGQEGALERFLEDLVDDDDPLLPLAETSTAHARAKGARFPEGKHLKAVLYTWLAWQEDPGLPYGSAIKAGYFRDDSPAARAFVGWYKRVFA